MEIKNRAYHFYLITYGGNSITSKFNEGVFLIQDECVKVTGLINHEYTRLKKDLLHNPNRYMILNFCTGLYLGDEDMPVIKNKFCNAIVISKINPNDLYINFEKESKFVYKYLVSQWIRLNNLV